MHSNKKAALWAAIVLLVSSCASEPPRRPMTSRPLPSTDSDRDRQCAEIRQEIARQYSLMQASASSQFAIAFMARARQNIAELESRSEQIQCSVVRVAPTNPVVPAASDKMNFEQCFAKCREVTSRTEEACFDACK